MNFEADPLSLMAVGISGVDPRELTLCPWNPPSSSSSAVFKDFLSLPVTVRRTIYRDLCFFKDKTRNAQCPTFTIISLQT